jgi:fructokinase
MESIYGSIEAGGTKFVCAVGTSPDDIRAETRIPTSTPVETLASTIAFFEKQPFPLKALGIACFGPVDLNRDSPTFGYITKTPKPNWSNTDVAGVIGRALNIPVGFDTDVNGALLGEQRWGAAEGLESAIYFTIGTGIGAGAVAEGKLVHGLVHPEMGHMLLPHDRAADPFPGFCPFHGDCFEGLAAGPAVEARWGQRAENLPPDHPAWDLEAEYIARALHTLVCVYSPKRIILGGGMMNQRHLFPLIREKVLRSLNQYVQHPVLLDQIDAFIVPPALGNRAGILGGIALAQDAALLASAQG